MRGIIKKFYRRFDKFLEHSASGNLRLKARVAAILTAILILAVIIVCIILAHIEFEISVPFPGRIKVYEMLIGGR